MSNSGQFRLAASGRTGTQVGAGLGPRGGDLDSHPWPRRPGCQRHGCTSSSSPPTATRWMRRSVSCGPQAGRLLRIPTSVRTPSWTGGTPSPTGCPMRWGGCDAARTGSRSSTPVATRPAVILRPACDWPDTAHVAVDLARVRAVLHRNAADLGELARARLPQGVAGLPRSWSGPGTPGKTRSTGAAKPTSGLDTPTTRSGRADLRGHHLGGV
jgi:hypothetical protein